MNLNLLVLLLFCLTGYGAGQGGKQEWEANNYPNPTADGYAQCNMKSPANVCDPDGVLTESERYRVNYELNQLESRTRQAQGSNFCEKKGIVAAIAIAKHVRGGSENAVKMMANDILRRWTLDRQCSKSLVIVVSTDDKKFWVARDSRVPVYASEFTDIFTSQKPLFKDGKYPEALLNIIEATWDKALAKQGQASPDSRGEPFAPDHKAGQPPSKDKKGESGFAFPKIPMWFWLGLLFVVVPALCCCGCLYFCCCRRKGGAEGANKRQGPADLPDEEFGGHRPAPPRGFGGAGAGMQNLIGGIGAGAIGNSVSNWFRNRNAGGGAAAGGQVPAAGYGDYVPPGGGQKAAAGRGMYPSAEVKDEGGGGGW